MKFVFALMALSFSASGIAAECSWSDTYTWGQYRSVVKGSATEVTLKGSQLISLAKVLDMTGDAWTVVGGLRFSIPTGQTKFHACMPVKILEMNDSDLGTKRLNFTFETYEENGDTIVHLNVQNVLDEKLLFKAGDCKAQ